MAARNVEKTLKGSNGVRLTVNMGTKTIRVSSLLTSKVVTFQRILGAEVIEYCGSSVTSSDGASLLGRAVVGAALAGAAGAIIGGASSKKRTRETVNRVELHVSLDDPELPTVDVRLLSGESNRGGILHKQAMEKGRTWVSLLSGCARQGPLRLTSPNDPSATPQGPAPTPVGHNLPDDVLESLYETAWTEIESGDKDKATWIKALRVAGGDIDKAKSAYITERVDALAAEELESERGRKARFSVPEPDSGRRLLMGPVVDVTRIKAK